MRLKKVVTSGKERRTGLRSCRRARPRLPQARERRCRQLAQPGALPFGIRGRNQDGREAKDRPAPIRRPPGGRGFLPPRHGLCSGNAPYRDTATTSGSGTGQSLLDRICRLRHLKPPARRRKQPSDRLVRPISALRSQKSTYANGSLAVTTHRESQKRLPWVGDGSESQDA